MSIPKEPRQIMINLMYLVLTALLALNVSNEILNAFRTLSSSIDKSNQSIDQKNKEIYDQIKANEEAPGQREKVRPFREKADLVKAKATEMIAYLEKWKKDIVMEAGGYSKDDPGFPDRMDNIDATTLLLVEKKGGDEMKKRITQLREFMLSQIQNQKVRDGIAPFMPLKVDPVKPNDHNPTGDWSIGNFEHMPAIAALALFSKYENDVRSSEALIVKELFEEAHLKDIKFDTIAAVAVPKSSYVLEGDPVQASILMAAFNKSNKPTVSGGGGGNFKPAVNGVVEWETKAHGTGIQTVQGKITLQSEQGPIERNWKFEYMVGTTGASMQLDKMNVFYIGVANPVTVAAAGYSVEDVSIAVPGADIRPDSFGRKGHYNIWVDKPGNVEVAINAKTREGPVKKVGGMPVRVKRIPDPIAKLGGNKGGSMAVGFFKAQIAPAAVLDAFDFAAQFQIVAFTFGMYPKGKDYQGPFTVENRAGCRLQGPGANPMIVKLIEAARAGDRVFIEGIYAIGPDKSKRLLAPLVFTLTN